MASTPVKRYALFLCTFLFSNSVIKLNGLHTGRFHLSFHGNEKIPEPYLHNEKTIRSIGPFQCGVECIVDKKCKSFNYFEKEGKCELSAYRFDPCVTSSLRYYLQRAPGWEHFTKIIFTTGGQICHLSDSEGRSR
jgi:hypothetical protein